MREEKFLPEFSLQIDVNVSHQFCEYGHTDAPRDLDCKDQLWP